MTLLLIEDEPIFVKLLSEILKPYNAVIDTDETLRGCLHKMRTKVYDVLLLDLTLKDACQDETIEAIPEMADIRPQCPIIVMSGANNVNELRQRCIQAGAKMFFPKEGYRKLNDAVKLAMASIVFNQSNKEQEKLNSGSEMLRLMAVH